MIAWIFGLVVAVVRIVGGLVLLAMRDYERGLQGLSVLELTEEDDGS